MGGSYKKIEMSPDVLDVEIKSYPSTVDILNQEVKLFLEHS